MARVLYISYTGLLDPLGQSQVLQYVRGLAQRGHAITVLSFERPEALSQTATLRADCAAAGIEWHPVPRRGSVGVMRALPLAGRLARRCNADIVHARSYIPGLLALGVKRATGARFVFDMRGFWPDERVDGGIWSDRSLVYRGVKVAERRLFQDADHLVSLTQSGIDEIAAMPVRLPPATVIPTCTNLDLFAPKTRPRTGFTLGYVGSVGSWYLFDAVAVAVARCFALRSDARFLVVTQGDPGRVRAFLRAADVDLSRTEICAVAYADVPAQIARMDAGVFFIRPAWSKRASSPTRMGEFLACGKPVLTNGGVGDVAADLTQTGTGIALPPDGQTGVALDGLDAALHQLFAMAADPAMARRCRAAAEARLALALGVDRYDKIYEALA